jgi:hypothetical protein
MERLSGFLVNRRDLMHGMSLCGLRPSRFREQRPQKNSSALSLTRKLEFTIWDGIAMHASPIAQFKPVEISLVAEGAGADVLGVHPSQVRKREAEEIAEAFPRLGFKSAFLKTCANVVRKHPRGASRGFMRDIGERYVAELPSEESLRRAGAGPIF